MACMPLAVRALLLPLFS